MKTSSKYKHYHRKKFFYRLFLRKSPREGAMFGLAWLMCWGALLPLSPILFCNTVADFVDDVLEPLLGQELSGTIGILSAILFFISCVLVYAYGFLTFSRNFYSILRRNLKKSSIWKIPAFLGAWFHGLSILLLFPVTIKKRLWKALFFLCGSLALAVVTYCTSQTVPRWWFAHGSTFLLLCAIGMLRNCGKFTWKFVCPLAVFLLFTASLLIGEKYYQNQIRLKQQQLTEKLGCDVSIAGWKERNNKGFPIDQAPLKSFCQSPVPEELPLKYDGNITAEEAREQLSGFRQYFPDFFKKMEAFRALEPQRISHKWPDSGIPVAGMLLPELMCFRCDAVQLALEMRSANKDKTTISASNRNLQKLREWCFHNDPLLHKLVAVSIEGTRLRALSHLIGSGEYSREELVQLLGPEHDWGKEFSKSLPEEIAMMEELALVLHHEAGDNGLELAHSDFVFWKFYMKWCPMFLNMNLCRDHVCALNHYLKLNESLLSCNQLSGLDIIKTIRINEDDFRGDMFFISHTGIPAWINIFPRISYIQDSRQMALLAMEVMDYRRQHGKLPADLAFLPQIPLSKLDNTPIMYETTADGFRFFTHTEAGEMPAADDTRHSYAVRLEMN